MADKIITVELDQLVLDSQNPRIAVYLGENESYDEDMIINVLQTYEELDVIIQSIKEKSWLSLSRPIVISNKDNIYTVKDGNRRIASLKHLKKQGIKILPLEKLEVELVDNSTELYQKILVDHTKGIQYPFNLVQMAVCRASNLEFSTLYRLWQYCNAHNISDFAKKISHLPIIEKILTNKNLETETYWHISLSEITLKTDLGDHNTVELLEYLFKNINELKNKDISVDFIKQVSEAIGLDKKKNEYAEFKDHKNDEDLFPSGSQTPPPMEFRASKKLLIDDDKAFSNFVNTLCKSHNVKGSKDLSYNMLLELANIKPSKTPTAAAMLLRGILEKLLAPIDKGSEKQAIHYVANQITDNKELRETIRNADTVYSNLSNIVHGNTPVTPVQIYSYTVDLRKTFEYLISIFK